MYYPREAQRDYLFTRATLILIAMIPVFLLMQLAREPAIKYAVIKSAYREAPGVVTDVYEPRFLSLVSVYYSFEPSPGVTQQGFYQVQSEKVDVQKIIGQPVTLAYCAWQPDFSMPRDKLESDPADVYIFFVGLALMVLGIGFFARTVYLIIIHKEQDRHY